MKYDKRKPCHYCGRLFTVTTRLERGVEEESLPIRVHDIEDHDCAGWPSFPPLLPFDPDFKVIPSRDEAEMAYALGRYRRSVK